MDPFTALTIAGSIVQIIDFSARTCSHVDIIAVHGISGHRETTWLQDSLHEMLEIARTVKARLLVYGYNEESDGLVGKDVVGNLDAIHRGAQELLHILTQKRRTKKERTRPIVFIGSGGGASLIKRALLLSKESPPWKGGCSRAIFTSSRKAIFFGRPHLTPRLGELGLSTTTMDPEKHIFSLYEIRSSESINGFQTWSSTSVNQSDSWKSRGQELSLLACQIAGTAVMGNYQRSSNKSIDPQRNSMHAHEGSASSNAMLWQCAAAESSWPGMSRYLDLPTTCSTWLPKIILYPSSTAFVIACIAFGISAMTFYKSHTHDRLQQPILILGLIAGLASSYYLHLQETSLNVITTVLPSCLTLSLFISALTHWIFSMTLVREEERACRAVEQWAQSFAVSGVKPLGDEKEGLTLPSAPA